MQYKIGELAKILDVSTETIRYYESKGIITSQRDKNSNYRLYSGWDVLTLMDCNIYRRLNFSLQECAEATNSSSITYAYDVMGGKIEDLQAEIEQRQILLDWMKKWRANMEDVILNIGSISLQQLPEMVFKFTGSKNSGDDLADYSFSTESMTEQARCAPYCVPTFYTTTEQINKSHKFVFNRGGLLHKEYIDKLNLTIHDECKYLPKQIYLTYAVEIGDIGNMNRRLFEPMLDVIENKGYSTNGDIFGMFIARFKFDNKYHRYLQIVMPITSSEQAGLWAEPPINR